jgi:hypothetical protein
MPCAVIVNDSRYFRNRAATSASLWHRITDDFEKIQFRRLEIQRIERTAQGLLVRMRYLTGMWAFVWQTELLQCLGLSNQRLSTGRFQTTLQCEVLR